MSCSAILKSGARKGEVCNRQLNDGKCRYKSHNNKKITLYTNTGAPRAPGAASLPSANVTTGAGDAGSSGGATAAIHLQTPPKKRKNK